MTENQRQARIRLFTGLSLSEPVREHVAGIVQELSRALTGVRWVAVENFHVTLKFIGWCAPSVVEGIVSMMEEATEFLPLRLEVGGVGAFPSVGSAKVIWVGAHDPQEKVQKIYRALDKAGVSYGFEREKRRYLPHVTVGRAGKKKVSVSGALLRRFENRVILDVEDIVLFKSQLKRTGAEYTVLKRIGGCGHNRLRRG